MEHLKQILEFNDDDSFKQIKPEFNNEILQFVAPEDIIWMMNNIASNDEVGDDLSNLESIKKGQINLTKQIDKTIIAGYVLDFDDVQFDASAKKKLNKMQKQLTQNN